MRHRFCSEFDLQIVEYGQTFDTELIERSWKTRRADPNYAAREHFPLLVDLRETRLLQLEASDIRRLARARMHLGPAANKVCCWVSDDGSFGMLRMYAAYSDVLGVRQETDFDIHLLASGVLEWLKSVAGLSDTAAQSLIADLSRGS